MPNWTIEIRRRLAGVGLSPTREAAIVDELSQHLQDRYAELCGNGVREADAHRAVLSELDDLVPALAGVERPAPELPPPGTPGRRFLADALHVLGLVVRLLRRHPGSAAVIVLM